MDNLILSPISIGEMRKMIREELQATMSNAPVNRNVQPTDEYLTIEETAKYINMAVSSVYGFVHFKRIPYIKRGKRLIFEKSKIDEWLQAGRKQTIDEIENQAIANVHSHISSKKRK